MNKEVSKYMCKDCGDIRTKSKHRNNKKNYYLDCLTGRFIKSNQCPKCREIDLHGVKLEQPRNYKNDRFCNHCKKKLPQNRYFNHLHCVPEVSDYDSTDYGYRLNSPAIRMTVVRGTAA